MKVYRLRNLKLGGYNPINVGTQVCKPGHAFGPATRTHWLLHFIRAGKGVFKRASNSYSLSAGQCFVIRPGEVTFYKADTSAPWEYVWIGFTANSIPKVLQERDVLSIPSLAPLFAEIAENVERLNGEDGKDGIREAWLCGRITEILTRIELQYARFAETKLQSEMRIVKNYIDTRLASELSVAALAAQFHMDRAYLSRCFKEVVGLSPQQYIVAERLALAARLMTENLLSPTDAATAVGYSDIYLFSKMFKRRYGVSPRTYKKKEP